VQALSCSSGWCGLTAAPQETVREAEKRLRQHTLQRRLIKSDPYPLLLFAPIEASIKNPGTEPLPGESIAFKSAYQHHYFMADGLYIHRQFFPAKRDGFFIEVGGLDGAADGSNSFFYERYLNWRGLMIEASPFNFANLFMRRPLAYRLEAALGAQPQTLRFAGHGCCGKVVNGDDSYRVQTVPIGQVLRAMAVQRVDFWSLDVSRASPTAVLTQPDLLHSTH